MLLNFFSVTKDTLGVSCALHIAQRIRVLRASNDFLSFSKLLNYLSLDFLEKKCHPGHSLAG